jgi:NAD(P)-dependent dehydrogenase (short-subunit alcohol dehydrogenase family)
MPETALSGQTALITGAAKRIGREIALTLAAEGVNIVAHYRESLAEAQKLGQELEERGVKCWLVPADFERETESSNLIQRALDQAGKLDILVNSASIFPSDTLENVSLESLSRNLRVNTWAPFSLCRQFAHTTQQGKIINILDTRVGSYDWTHVSYILSKHVLGVLTRMLAIDYAPDITVNGVAPGLILPPPGKDMSYLEHLVNTVPLKRHGDPSDVAQAVLFLLKSDFVTGTVIEVDGGRHLMEYSHGSHSDQ